ncbi:MAG: CBS domain-containing protein [Proteobacteria bacterium]|nr:CBS domain-containing protein [Pseudomonadota bacterium]MBU1583548.1 CBS domain-containing protein [Pseudomonadota bacterium]MBU2455845.1 CBS domain-containing protein [Pseudomonadota bacterium]MBU2627855.1 CBS domain-containing protein [Pseudomonadota bacterium]
MIVKNWMRKDPETISSDLSAKEAMKLFETKKIPFLSVVDDNKFRGILARRDLRAAASWAIATQDIHEIQFFNEKLKVKDIMVRKPVTLSINDSVETALEKGKQFGRTFLPVMEDGRLVGSLSNRDFTHALSQLLGTQEGLHSASIEINKDSNVTIKKILEDIFVMGLEIKGLFTLKDPDSGVKRLIIRFEAKCLKRIVSLIKEKGYNLIEVVKDKQ